MSFAKLNPFIRSAAVYEKVNRTEPCISCDCRLIYLISGELSYTVGSEGGKAAHRGRLAPGNLLFIPAGTPYSLKTKYMRAAVFAFDPTDDYSEESVKAPSSIQNFDAETVHTLSAIPPFDKVILIEDLQAERDNVIKMCNLFISAEGTYLAEASAVLKRILLRVAELCDENALPVAMIENLDSYIRENVSDEISNTELGAIFGYHPFYISRMLKSKKGITLHQYVSDYRIKHARCALVYTGKTVAEIAEECGFTDSSYFTKIFKNRFGMTPKEYRNQFKEDFI